MNNQMKFYLRHLVLWYYNFHYSKYYPVVMPLVTAAVGIIVFVFLILPQLANWLSVQNEIQATQDRINVMRQNSTTLGNLNKNNVDRDFAVAARALPFDKDFTGVLNSIGQAAVNSGAILNDYEFSLGAIPAGRDNKKSNVPSAPVNIRLKLEGSIDSISKFMSEIERKLPIAEVKNLNYSEGSGEFILVFYMESLPKQELNYSDPILALDQDQRGVLQTLYEWVDQ